MPKREREREQSSEGGYMCTHDYGTDEIVTGMVIRWRKGKRRLRTRLYTT